MLTSSSQTPLGGSVDDSPVAAAAAQPPFPGLQIAPKKKRRPAGTPDPDADVVALSPRTLLESDRYVCEICNQGFQRDQNLQMHRRRHKVPWKLLKREEVEGSAATGAAQRKRVYVCPEPSCLHHEAGHALGDLVGIKKHFRRKHSTHRQWACARCSKAYAVHSDFKAHLKTCGTRGHSCDCGRVFSRVESFIEHQDACNASQARTELPPHCSTASPAVFLRPGPPSPLLPEQLELQFLPSPSTARAATLPVSVDEARITKLQLSVGEPTWGAPVTAARDVGAAGQQLRLAMADKAAAEEARRQARRQMELAEQELAEARRIRQQAQVELERAHAVRDHAVKQINAALLQVTCYACRQRFRAKPPASEDNSFVTSYVSYSSAATEGGEVVNEEEGGGLQRKVASA